MAKTVQLDWWVDGHFIGADSAQEAHAEVLRLYNYNAELVRPWTAEDQADLDAMTEDA